MMIYGIAGASGTGKTTLGSQVGDALSISFVRTSVTEMARKAGFEAVSRLTLPDRVRLQNSLLEQFEELLHGIKGPAILDRTPIDLIGYLGAEIHMHSHEILDIETLESLDGYFLRCQKLTAQCFDRVFVTSILPHYETAETRPDYNPAYQRHVHWLITGAAVGAESEINATLLLSGNLHDRVTYVSQMISERLQEIDKSRKKLVLH
jgi:predicted ATPase